MKLEAGKKYVLRNGRVEKCLAVWTEPVGGYQATLTYHPAGMGTYALNGNFRSDGRKSPYDIVAEHKEPKKYKITVFLYADGRATLDGILCESHPLRSSPRVVRTQVIEWEVPDNG